MTPDRRSLPTEARLRLFAAGWEGAFTPDAVGSHGDPLLCWAIQHCPPALPVLLPVLAAADLNRADALGWSSLMWACLSAPGWVAPLLAAGADADHQDTVGWTPLMIACQERPSVVPALLAAGADPHRCAHDGTSALMIACRNGPGAVPALLAAGACIGTENDKGHSAWSIAVRERPEVLPLLDRGRQAQEQAEGDSPGLAGRPRPRF